MPISLVGYSTYGSGSSLSLTSLTGGSGSSPAAGDVVVLVTGVGGGTAHTTVATGYTQIANVYANDSYDANLYVGYKVMGSTPDTSITLTSTPAANATRASTVYVFRGVDTSNPIDVTTTTATITNSILADPPSITPVTSGAWILVAAAGGNLNGDLTYSSSELSSFTSVNDGPTLNADIVVGVGLKTNWTSGAFNPAAFSAGSDNIAWSASSATVALRPLASVSLSPNGLTTGAPTLATTTLAQRHATTPVGLTAGTPTVAATTITQRHTLTASGVTAGAPTVATLSLTQIRSFTPVGITTGAPTVATTTLRQTQRLSPNGVTTGVPSVASVTLTQRHTLTSVGVTAGTPFVASTTLSQRHSLIAQGVTSAAPSVASTGLGQTHSLTATGVTTGAPVVGTPTASVSFLFTLSGITAGSPSVPSLSFQQTYSFEAVGFDAGEATVDETVIVQYHTFTPSAITTDRPNLGTLAILNPEQDLGATTFKNVVFIAAEVRIAVVPPMPVRTKVTVPVQNRTQFV